MALDLPDPARLLLTPQRGGLAISVSYAELRALLQQEEET